MYTRLLVPLDGSKLAEQVLSYVRALGGALGSPITLLRLFDPMTIWLGRPRGQDLEETIGSFREQSLGYLGTIKASMDDLGVAVSCLVQEGDPASGIISEAQKEAGTLITLSTHGRSGVTRWALGSVTDKVLHSTVAPVLVVRPGGEQAPPATVALKAIIAPLDGSLLAEQSLPYVESLAKALSLTVMLVRVTAHYTDEAREYLHEVGDKLRQRGLPMVEERLLYGHPSSNISDFSREVQANLVAMTSHGHSGVRRWVLGSVTNSVVRDSGDPVLVIRAQETPVESWSQGEGIRVDHSTIGAA